MARYAPAIPTTETLQGLYPLNEVAEFERDVARQRTGGILTGEQPGLVGVTGPCAPTAGTMGIIRREGAARSDITEAEEGLLVVGRTNVWKPRTRAEDWHGLETDDPDGPEIAYRLLAGEAIWSSGVAMEVNWQNEEHTETHVDRYADLLTIAWFGARAINDVELMKHSALAARDIPLAVKNGLDGELQPALQRIDMLRGLRGNGAAPVVLMYRGGKNAQDPQTWERQYRAAMEATEGRMIVDTAHGSEMAHDPAKQFGKSVRGQLRSLAHIERIARQKGEMPNGVLIEASGIESPVDPNIPHQTALNGLVRLNELRRSRQPAYSAT